MGFRRCHFVIPFLAIQAGCASWLVRTEGFDTRANIYPATTIDVGIVSAVVTRPFTGPPDSDTHEALIYVLLPAAVVDLPLALVVDTVLLPHDLRGSARGTACTLEDVEQAVRALP